MDTGDQERIDLAPALSSVAQARAFLRERLGDKPPELLDDAELVLNELVANAVLHAPGSPISVNIHPEEWGVRLEVADQGGGAPVALRPSDSAMTGRGLALVGALAVWGADHDAHGKVVWAEIGRATMRSGEQPTDEELLAGWYDDGEPRFTVRLGSVPTPLLLAAKEHVDNVVRELTLIAAGRDDDPLVRLVSTVVEGFAEARSAIKRQAITARNSGEDQTHLVLELPASTAEAGDAYLAGLDELDRYARAARLLTLESPLSHQVFRRWYVTALTDQLRAQAAGAPGRKPIDFSSQLALELDALAHLRVTAERSKGLYEVGAALAKATDAEEVARLVVHEGARVLGAHGGVLSRRGADGVVQPLAAMGVALPQLHKLAPIIQALPAPSVWRTGEPRWFDGPEAMQREFPQLHEALAELEPTSVAFCVVPVPSSPPAGLRFTFDHRRLFDDDERRFVLALADQAAVALDRAAAYSAEQAARADAEASAHRLDLISRVTGALTGARGTEEIAEIVTTMATSELGASSARLYLLIGRVLRSVAVVNGSLTATATYDEVPADSDLPGAEALRTNQPVYVPDLAELVRRWPVLEGAYDTERSLLVAPLTVRGHQLGVLSLTFERGLTDSDPATQVSFVQSVAHATAQALERSLATDNAEDAANRYRTLVGAISFDVWHASSTGELLSDMPRWRTVAGSGETAVLGDGWLEDVHPDDRERVAQRWTDAVRTGEKYDVVYRVTGSGGRRWIHARAVALRGEDDSVLEWIGVSEDVTLEQESLDLNERLLRAADSLSEALTLSDVIAAITRALQSAGIGHTSGVAMPTSLDTLELHQLTGESEGAERWAHFTVAEDNLFAVAWRLDEDIFCPTLESLHEVLGDVPAYDWAAASGLRSWAALPLPGPHGPLGVLLIAWDEEQAFSEHERTGLQTLAALCAAAVQRSLVHDEQQRSALRLQERLLPQALPEVTSLDIAASYRAGAAGMAVGGDFYDVIALPDDRVLLVMGDVMGRGVAAAAAMARLRGAVETAAALDDDPVAVVSAVDRLYARRPADDLLTLLVARLELSTGRLEIVSAGHPPPLLSTTAGCSVVPIVPGPPAGWPDVVREVTAAVLPVEGSLVTYTDGLVERRGTDIERQLDALCAFVAGFASSEAEVLADRLMTEVDSLDEADDTALLVVRRLS